MASATASPSVKRPRGALEDHNAPIDLISDDDGDDRPALRPKNASKMTTEPYGPSSHTTEPRSEVQTGEHTKGKIHSGSAPTHAGQQRPPKPAKETTTHESAGHGPTERNRTLR